MISSKPPPVVAVRITGDRATAALAIQRAGGSLDAFELTVDYATGAALVVARDVEGLHTLERLLEEGIALPVRDMPRRMTARSMPKISLAPPDPGKGNGH